MCNIKCNVICFFISAFPFFSTFDIFFSNKIVFVQTLEKLNNDYNHCSCHHQLYCCPLLPPPNLGDERLKVTPCREKCLHCFLCSIVMLTTMCSKMRFFAIFFKSARFLVRIFRFLHIFIVFMIFPSSVCLFVPFSPHFITMQFVFLW